MIVRALIFFAIAFAILFGLHYYIWARLVRDAMLPQPWRSIATGALIALGAGMFALFPLMRALSPQQVKWAAWPIYVWMGALMFFFFGLLIGDLVRLFLWAGSRGAPPDPERRQWLQRVIGGAVAVMAGGLSAVSLREGLRAATVTDVNLPVAKLPQALDGFTIVQLTDLHVGPTIGKEWLEDVVARTNALEPDLVAITGDLVDGSVHHLRDAVSPLTRLKSKHGVFFVTGNHEYYSGVEEWLAELTRIGVRCLRNEHVTVAGGELVVAGIDDQTSRESDLDKALSSRDKTRACVLLAHQPKAIHGAARHGVDVQLSGHTHGGQIWPWNYLVRLQQPYVAGHVVHEGTHLYVSRGTGYWGPPMRLGTIAEIAKITLRRT